MKLAEKSKHADPRIETALQMVDEEMRKIVADIDAHRPVRPTGKPRGSTPSVVPRYDGRHRALPNSNFAVLRGGR